VRERYRRWAFQERQTDSYYAHLNKFTTELAEHMCTLEDARFLAMIDRMVASGRRLYYRRK